MQLDNTVSPRGSYYELGSVVAIEYLLDQIPSADQSSRISSRASAD
jgi:hypothetical protein